MNNGWQTKAVGDLCRFINGLWKGEKPPFVNVGVFRNTNFTKEGTLDDSDVAYLDVEQKKFEKRRLAFGDLILEKSGGGPRQPVGRVALFDKKDGDFSFSNFTAAMRVVQPTALDFRFLHKFLYWTHLSGVTEAMQSHSTGIRNLDGDAYKRIGVPLPPLAEQRRIVGILDKAFAAIATAKANAEKNLQNARALFENLLESVFSECGRDWPERVFSDVCEISSSLVDPRLPKHRELLHVGGANIETRTGGLIDLRTANDEGLISGKFLFDSTVVLYSKIRPYLMKVARPDFTGLCSADIYPLRVKNGQLDRDFLFFLLLSPRLTEYAIKGSARAGMPKVNRDHLFAFRVRLPPKKEQERYAAQLDAVHEETQRLELLYRRKLAALDELKRSVLHQAFSGQP